MKGNGEMGIIGEGALAVAMIAAFLLIVFGVRMAMKGGDRKRAALMIGAAAVLVGNVVIMTA
jgi:cell division protein FtsW (lipid II flippase)